MKKSVKFYSSRLALTVIIFSLLGIGLMGMFSIALAQGDAWTKKANMPTARMGLAIVVVNDSIYAIGGYPRANSQGLKTNEVYDPSTDTWTKKLNMPTKRLGLAASVVKGKIYVIGGASLATGGHPGVKTVEEYDPANDLTRLIKKVSLSKCK